MLNWVGFFLIVWYLAFISQPSLAFAQLDFSLDQTIKDFFDSIFGYGKANVEFSNDNELTKEQKIHALQSAQDTAYSGIDFWFGFHDTIVALITSWSGGVIDPMIVLIISSFVSVGMLIFLMKRFSKRGLIIGIVVVGVVFALMVTNVTLGF